MKVNTKLLLFLLLLSIFIPNLFNIRLIGMNLTFGRTVVIAIFLFCLCKDNGRIFFRHKLESITVIIFGCWLTYGTLLMLLTKSMHKAAAKELINIFFGVLIIYCMIRLIGDSREMLDCAVVFTEKLIMFCVLVGIYEIITGRHLAASIFCDLNHIKSLTEIYGNINFHQATGFQYGTNDFSAFLTFFFPIFLLKDRRGICDYLMIGGIAFICAVNSSTLCILTIILSIAFYLIKEKRVKARHIIGIVISFIVLYTVLTWVRARYGNTFSLTADLQNHLYNYQKGNGSSYKRFWTYVQSILIGIDTFFLGIGPANFSNYIISGSYRKVLLNPHNLWLEIFTEYGALIMVCYVTLLFVIYRKAGHIYKRYGIQKALLIQMMLMGYLIVGIVPSTFISYWYQWILVALGISAIKLYETKKRGGYRVKYEKVQCNRAGL